MVRNPLHTVRMGIRTDTALRRRGRATAAMPFRTVAMEPQRLPVEATTMRRLGTRAVATPESESDSEAGVGRNAKNCLA